jgi:hypothetical protein
MDYQPSSVLLHIQEPDKFPNYYNEFVNKSNEPRQETDSGVASDISEPPRGFGSPTLSTSSDLRPSPTYQDTTISDISSMLFIPDGTLLFLGVTH